MPDWLATLAGWVLVVLGGLGLWRGATLLLSAGAAARDSTGTPAGIVLVESGTSTLIGAAVLLGSGWVHLMWPAFALMTIGASARIRIWLRRRRRFVSLPNPDDERH